MKQMLRLIVESILNKKQLFDFLRIDMTSERVPVECVRANGTIEVAIDRKSDIGGI